MGLLIFLFIKTYIVVTYYLMPILYIFCFIFYTFLALRSHFFLLSLPYFMFSHNFSIPWHFYSRIRNCNITQIPPLRSVSISELDYCNLFYILIKKCTKKGYLCFSNLPVLCVFVGFFFVVCLFASRCLNDPFKALTHPRLNPVLWSFCLTLNNWNALQFRWTVLLSHHDHLHAVREPLLTVNVWWYE